MIRQYKEPAQIVTDTIRRIYDAGLTTMSGGNLSLKDGNGDIWVTPGGLDKGCLVKEDIMKVTPDGTITGNTKVTSEFVVHKAILDKRRDKKAVLHAHSPVVLGFSTARVKPEESLLAASFEKMGDRITISPYQKAGSPQLAETVSSHLEGDSVATILENHGLFMVGDTMEECYDNLELLELAGNIEVQAKMLGAKLCGLTAEEKALLKNERTRMPEEEPGLLWNDSDRKAAEKICSLMERMYSRNINTASTGSCSVRMPDGSMVITPQGKDVLRLKPEDLVKTAGTRCEPNKVPDQSYELHREIYEANPEVTVIIMAVPRYLMTYAVSDASFSSESVWEAYYLLRDVPKYPFGRGKKFRRMIAGSFGERVPTLLVQNDCYIVTSNNIMDAYDKVEVAEATAKGAIMTSVVKAPVAVEEEIIQMYDSLIDQMLFGREP